MCGIFGFWLNRPLSQADLTLGQNGITALKHRGPDNLSTWSDIQNGIFLGHARLSIIDLSEQSNQPMHLNNAVLVYNGEIYNYKELAAELNQSNVQFKTQGDTEVLLQAWQKWGPACLDKLDGMYAFALFQNSQLHLISDPFGEKPLYWAKTKDGIFFSSEPMPLVKALHLPPQFTSHEIAAFLSLGFLPAPHTGYQNLYRIPPGTRMTFATTGDIQTHKYWTPPQPQEIKGPVQALSDKNLDTITEDLVASLRVRLRADVPVGIFLSSGIDSALVATLATKELHQTPLAFTVRFNNEDVNDESFQAAEIAKYLNLPHSIVDNTEDPALADPSVIFDLYGETNDNLTVAAAYQMSQLAVSKLKVALSGIGGDEIFYGYNKYQMAYRWQKWLALNPSLRHLISRFYPSAILKRWRQLPRLLSASETELFIAIKNTNICDWLWQIPNMESFTQAFFTSQMPKGLLTRYFDLIYTLPGTFIPAIERASMRASLEVRTPFLNRKLLDTLNSFDQRALLAFGQKSVLKRIIARYLPSDRFRFATKKGFHYPKQPFLNQFENLPQITDISQAHIQIPWNNRTTPKWQTLATRLAILDHFMHNTTA